jgi:hypothetical protein
MRAPLLLNGSFFSAFFQLWRWSTCVTSSQDLPFFLPAFACARHFFSTVGFSQRFFIFGAGVRVTSQDLPGAGVRVFFFPALALVCLAVDFFAPASNDSFLMAFLYPGANCWKKTLWVLFPPSILFLEVENDN